MGTPERRQKIVEGFEQTLLGPVRHSESWSLVGSSSATTLWSSRPASRTRAHTDAAKPSLESSTPELSVSNVTKRHAGVAATSCYPPWSSATVLLNADFPVALEAEVVDPAGQRRTVGFDTNGTACDLETGVELEDKWWKTHKVVRYGPVLWLMNSIGCGSPSFELLAIVPVMSHGTFWFLAQRVF